MRIRPGHTVPLTLLLDARPTYGAIRVSSDPSGARWYLDGDYMGLTPDTAKTVQPGGHEIDVKRPGHYDWTGRVTVQAGRMARIAATLRPTREEYALTVNVEPADARVRILNIVPRYYPGIRLSPGSYHVRVDKEGYETFDDANVVIAEADRTLDVTLSPEGRGDTWTEPVTDMTFVRIAGGCFQMGSPEGEEGRFDNERQHRVCVDGFALAAHEVTNRQYRLFRRDHDSGNREGHSLNGDDQPVVNVSWKGATAYAEWLSKRTGKRFRLPTEAEWEYAARAGTTTARFWGDDPDQACRHANVHDLTSSRIHGFTRTDHECDDGHAVSAPVGTFRPNHWGLYDMLGNVSEWTCSSYESEYNGSEKRCVSKNDAGRVACRGGGWLIDTWGVRSADRNWLWPDLRVEDRGFRLLQDLGEG